MESEKAFWQALMTVGIPFLLWGILLYSLGVRADEWLVYLVFVGLPALPLFALVYHRYRKGPKPAKLTRRQHLVRATLLGCFAIFYLVLALINLPVGWRNVPNWIMVIGWLIGAADHLRLAYKEREIVPAES